VIVSREETISDDRIREELKGYIQKCANGALEVYIWPESASDIPDNKNLKLAIFGPEFLYDSEKGRELSLVLFEKAGTSFRIYKNTLFIVATDNAQYATLSRYLKRLLAISEVQNDKGLLESLTKESQDELKKKLKDAEKEMPFMILNAYRHLMLAEANGPVWKDLGIPTVGVSTTISKRVKQHLKDQERILSRITPKYIIDKTFASDEVEKELRDIYELFIKTPGMPILESDSVLLEAVKEGVKSGLLGIREGQQVYYEQDIFPTMDSVILRGEVAKRIKDAEKEKEREKEKEEKRGKWSEGAIEEPEEEEKGQGEGEKGRKEETVTRLTLRAKIPWDKLSDIVRGVIGPLKEKGLPPEITIEIKAESNEGFDRTTLESQVKETLYQIGARIEFWDEC